MFKTPILMLKMKFFWLIFRGKFEQKTQKSIFLKNQWRLKNIKKAMVVKNIIAEDMPFTKSIFEQFWRSYCKKTIFVVFHFLKFLPFRVKYWNCIVEYAHYLGIDSNTDEEDNEDDDGIKTLTSLDGVKDLWVVGNNPLNKGPPAHTRGSHQHLRVE